MTMEKWLNKVHHGDCLEVLRLIPDKTIQCCITSPPYWSLRDYKIDGQLGLERTPEEYVIKMVEAFREVRRVLKNDGTLWLNLGDSYAGSWGDSGHRPERSGNLGHQRKKSTKWFERHGHPQAGNPPAANVPGLKPKDLCGIPWRVAFALQADGWWLRQDIIWHKPNPMPESVKDRCTKAHEYIFLLAKSRKYYCNMEAIKEPATKGAAGSTFNTGKTAIHQLRRASNKERKDSGLDRNKRSVWAVTTKPFKGAHFATFPPDLIEPCVLAGCPEGGTVLDPFIGSGTTAIVAESHGRKWIGIDLSEDYCEMAQKRIHAARKPS